MALTSRGKVRKPAAQTPSPAVDLQDVVDTTTSAGRELMEQLIEQQHAATIEEPATAPAASTTRKLPDTYFTESEVNTLLEHIADTTLATRLASAWRLALPLNADEAAALDAAFTAVLRHHLTLTDYKQATASGRLLGSLAVKLRITYGLLLEVRL